MRDFQDFKNHSHDTGWANWGYTHRLPSIDLHEELTPLVQTLEAYDELRVELEEKGATASTLEEMQAILAKPLQVGGDSLRRKEAPTLAAPGAVADAVAGLSPTLKFETRRHPHSGLPVFYLARTKQDYRTNYDQVIEDHFLSRGYPLPDPRYVQLSSFGRQRLHLRVSPFRQALEASDERTRDERLSSAAHHVFSAAWHEDQVPVLALAALLHMPELRNAVELLYLILGVDLCDLRGALQEIDTRFFVSVYPQISIALFLENLPRLSGEQLNRLPKLALERYARLSRFVGQFLRTQVPLRGRVRPLYQLLFANFTRLDALEPTLQGVANLQAPRRRLRVASREIQRELSVGVVGGLSH